MSLALKIKDKAAEIGFDVCGIAPARPADHAEVFKNWLSEGYHADMNWMGRDPDRRSDAGQLLDHARSVITVGLNYFVQAPPAELWNDPARGRISSYAWGPDYHDHILNMLNELAEYIKRESPNAVTRVYVDTGPLLERDYAQMAGLGFVGKNSMLIHPVMGSMFFLAEIITNLELEYDGPVSGRGMTCGECRRCMDQCPTEAFPAAHTLNSNRCIAYHTIENKGEIPVEIRSRMDNWIFGCDICQTVCPWVGKAKPPRAHPFLSFNPDTCCPLLTDLAQLDENDFRSRFKGTPIQRLKRRGLLRNVAVALGNWGTSSAYDALVLLGNDPDPLIKEHVEWAIKQCRALS